MPRAQGSCAALALVTGLVFGAPQAAAAGWPQGDPKATVWIVWNDEPTVIEDEPSRASSVFEPGRTDSVATEFAQLMFDGGVLAPLRKALADSPPERAVGEALIRGLVASGLDTGLWHVDDRTPRFGRALMDRLAVEIAHDADRRTHFLIALEAPLTHDREQVHLHANYRVLRSGSPRPITTGELHWFSGRTPESGDAALEAWARDGAARYRAALAEGARAVAALLPKAFADEQNGKTIDHQRAGDKEPAAIGAIGVEGGRITYRYAPGVLVSEPFRGRPNEEW